MTVTSTNVRTVVPGASGTGIDSQHPMYIEFVDDWVLMRDCYRGERVVKDKGTLYLPATKAMLDDGLRTGGANTAGFEAYQAYKTRAHFPDVVNDAVEAMVGIMHHKPPTIQLPTRMEPMIERATLRHESMEVLLRRINEQQLVTGRLGLLLDLPEQLQADPNVLPYIAMYRSEDIINWDEGRRDGIVVDNLNFVALNESEFERVRNFEWEFQRKFRVLILGDPEENEPAGQGVYRVGVFREQDSSFNEESLIEPSIRGQVLNEIPFVFINSKDIVPEPEDPPLIGLAKAALTIYRGDADYRQALFMQGQDTLVIIGGGEEEGDTRVGADAILRLPDGATAEYIGVNGDGLPEMRTALENDYNRAMQKGGQLMDSVSRERESGDALKIRVAARTATLNQVALAGAFGLQQILRTAAIWLGENPDDVVVEPNLDFVDDTLGGKELVDLLTAKSLGAPYSLRSIHEQMQEKGLTKRTFEEELAEIEGEPELGGGGTTDPNSPEDDPTEEPTDDVPDDGTGSGE